MTEINQVSEAYVILVDTGINTTRYYSNVNKKRITTAWSLAGAKLFLTIRDLSPVLTMLNLKKYTFKIKTVTLND